MRTSLRSASGVLLMLMIVPFVVGMLACLPVPIGDPERSRIDRDITGVWVMSDEPAFYAFETYDKRTWLLTGVPLEEGDNANFDDYDLSRNKELKRLMETESVGEDGATATGIVIYKAWMSKLGGVWFMTWEPKGLFGSEQFAPDTWFVFRVDKPDPETLELHMIGDDLFEGVAETRRAYERVIKKNAKNPELYTEEPLVLRKVADEHREFFKELAGEVVDHSE